MDTCEIVARGLFISGGDSSEVFERVEEALDEVALGVKSVVAVAFDGSVGLGRDDRFDAAHTQSLDEAIGVVSLVADEGFGLDLGGERLGLRHVVDLAAGETNGERQAERVDDDVDFRGQSAARSADRFLAAVFLGAPALC